MAFNLGDMLKDVSGLDTMEERIQKISLDIIDDDPGNFYKLTNLEELADNIATCGLMDPIRVRVHPENPERYMIVSGHRRRAAVAILAKDDPEKWGQIPCIIEAGDIPQALQQLRLIYANSNTRTLSSYEQSKQVEETERLLYELKNQGYNFPGRMRDHVAEACQVSKTKIARLKVIKDKLDPLWQKPWKSGKLPETKAYALAQMPAEDQHLLGVHFASTPDELREGLIRERKANFANLEGRSCDRRNGTPCINVERMREKAAKSTAWYYEECRGCCFDCDRLSKCQYACTMAADKKKELRAQAKESASREAEAQELKNRPKIQRIQMIYERIGKQRHAKGIDAKKLLDTCGRWYGPGSEENLIAFETGTKTITPSTDLMPFGHSFYEYHAKVLCEISDLLGCSIDYLLGRTDDPSWPAATSPSDTWQTGNPTAAGDYVVLYRYGQIGIDSTVVRWDGNRWEENGIVNRGTEILGWTTMPKEGTT